MNRRIGMRKVFTPLFLFFIITACNLLIPNNLSFEDTVATNVSIAKTATVVNNFIMTSTATANPLPNIPSPIPSSLSPTPTQINFKESLGMPDWKDELNNGGNWSLNKPNTDTPNVTLKVENGSLIMTRSVPYGGKNWWLNFRKLQDFYLEGKFTISECSSDDQYGLVFRAPNYFDGFGYYFTVTCDGNFNLMRWDSYGAVNLFKWEKPNAILAGPNQTNNLGIWAQGNLIRLYANEKMIKELMDSSMINTGHFGIFIDSRQTPGFTIKLDKIAYWSLH
jgi:hypothetical protein